jgi:DNA-binding CsgD family transcriptional regulator
VGDWDEAVERARAFGTTFPTDSFGAGATPARVLVDRGLFDEARARLHPPASPDVDIGHLVYAECSAKLALWEGRLRDARDILAEALPILEEHRMQTRLPWLAAWVEADIAERGTVDAATGSADEIAVVAWRDRARHLIEYGTPNGNRPAKEAAFYLELTDGEISRLRGRSDPTPWRTAAEHFTTNGYVYQPAYARFRLAEALIATNQDRAAAVDPLRGAYQTALRLGAQPLLGLIERLAARARIGLASGGVDDKDAPFGLTDRELQVLTLVAAGRSNRQIADELYISIKTASVHVSNILAKLGAASRGEAAALAHRLALDG